MTHPQECTGPDDYERLSAGLLKAIEAKRPTLRPHIIAAAEAVDLLCETYANPFTRDATAYMVRALAADAEMAGLVIGSFVEIATKADQLLDKGHRLFHEQSPEIQATIKATREMTRDA